ncbi:SCO2522 family protein [Frankia sp. Cppng1_Ct_nod]|uniref:SCO2522 family protein n=1 Tax=Frankia sp. Cppng1_Ct_nod TaxID=2897162 RepID=UPI001A9471D8|nr:SCO2522 family protein [Frankia sp. Cppng1_Ct_nod]
MTTLEVVAYSEASNQDNVRGMPLSHLSIEVGHFYMEDLLNGEERIRHQFQRLAPWVTAAEKTVAADRPRISTCFLIDDYFYNSTNPKEILRKLITIGDECGVPIDYIAREAGCCVADGVPLAELVAARLLPEPAPGTNGSRPPTHQSGWLCNGERSPETGTDQAMHTRPWEPPQEFGKRDHSIFLDVELWKEIEDRVDGETMIQRTWSCPFLASIWHLLRLGMLRHFGEPVAQPHRVILETDEIPETWTELPAVMQVNPRAAPFSAYRSVSILPQRYLPIENAIKLILSHLSLDEPVTGQVIERGAREGLKIPRKVIDRISHVFIEGS